jgi:hypothetical protein
MRHFRIRLSTLLWLVILAAVFMAGVRLFGEYLEATRRPALPAFRCSHFGESDAGRVDVEAAQRFPWQLAGQRPTAEDEDEDTPNPTPPGAQETPP